VVGTLRRVTGVVSCIVVQPGDRIAQMILEVIATPAVVECAEDDALSETVRGSDGFGSTGV